VAAAVQIVWQEIDPYMQGLFYNIYLLAEAKREQNLKSRAVKISFFTKVSRAQTKCCHGAVTRLDRSTPAH
jgi:hypothetical protein